MCVLFKIIIVLRPIPSIISIFQLRYAVWMWRDCHQKHAGACFNVTYAVALGPLLRFVFALSERGNQKLKFVFVTQPTSLSCISNYLVANVQSNV